MRRRAPLAVLALAAAALACGPGAARARATSSSGVSLSGSTTVLPVVADLAYFYRRSHRHAPRFTLTGGTSGSGIADVARGVVDAGLASRALGAPDPPGLVLTRIALSGICLVTNKANPVPGFSRATIQDLVAGRATDWSQVPGSPRTGPIVSAQLTSAGGGRVVFTSVFLDPATPVVYQPRTLQTAAQVRDYVLTTPGAWSYVDILYGAGLHVVPYEGIPCTRATIRSGAYPATRPLGIVTRGRPKGAVKRFVRWIHTSRVARRVIAARYVPAR